jgi:hypothetical protein
MLRQRRADGSGSIGRRLVLILMKSGGKPARFSDRRVSLIRDQALF